jgi:glycosyltransferase involved in cell wall biosynthesis
MGHDVTVMSEIGGPLTDMAKRANIKVVSLKNPPGYKLGDGKWTIKTQDGNVIPSTPNSMYKLSEVHFDLIHTQHTPITEFVCNLYPNIEKIATIHSEVIELEKPVIHDSIKHYICIRPEIQEYINEVYDIDINKTSVVYNPVDDSRFISSKTDVKNAALFVGTIDYLRESSIRDMVEMTKKDGLEFWLVGENKSNYLDELLQFDHVKHFKSTWNTEKYIQQVKYTAGILLGRTTIESWMCGKPAWIYNVDSNGGILDKTLHEPPTNGEMDKFKLSNVSKLVHEKYLKVVNRK